MGGQEKARELLDRLAELMGCDYLSDLQSPGCRAALHREIARLPAEAFPEEEWRKALRYLGGGAPRDADGAALRRLLLDMTA